MCGPCCWCYCCAKRPLFCLLLLVFFALVVAGLVTLAVVRVETVMNQVQRWMGVSPIKGLLV